MGYDAEYSYVPSSITTKAELYGHILENLKSLLEDRGSGSLNAGRKTNWVSALSSVASVLYNSYADFPSGFGSSKRVNWAGFYVIPGLFPSSSSSSHLQHERARNSEEHDEPTQLLIAPYHGRPGCLRIPLNQKRKGVCADAFLSQQTVVVQDVHEVPGHIACDGTTESEIVLPLLLPLPLPTEQAGGDQGKSARRAIGVLDIDCQKAGAWDEEDKKGLEAIVSWLVSPDGVVDWGV